MNLPELLIVDDEDVSREFLSAIIEDSFKGVIIHDTDNSKNAIEIFRNNNIKIVLLDILLPGDISGIDIFLKLKEIRKDFRAIAITSYNTKFGFKCGQLGFDEFLNKPINSEDLINRLKLHINSIQNNVKGNIFCIMPFTEKFYDTYIFGIKQTLNDLGFYCYRIDEEIFNDSIIDKIKESIITANYIVADISTYNPNVYYEIGFAHALGKKVILICNSIGDLKFDLQHMRTIIYSNISDLRLKLEKEFKVK